MFALHHRRGRGDDTHIHKCVVVLTAQDSWGFFMNRHAPPRWVSPRASRHALPNYVLYI